MTIATAVWLRGKALGREPRGLAPRFPVYIAKSANLPQMCGEVHGLVKAEEMPRA